MILGPAASPSLTFPSCPPAGLCLLSWDGKMHRPAQHIGCVPEPVLYSPLSWLRDGGGRRFLWGIGAPLWHCGAQRQEGGDPCITPQPLGCNETQFFLLFWLRSPAPRNTVREQLVWILTWLYSHVCLIHAVRPAESILPTSGWLLPTHTRTHDYAPSPFLAWVT